MGASSTRPRSESAAHRSLSRAQALVLVVVAIAVLGGVAIQPRPTLHIVVILIQAGFVIAAGWRLVLVLASLRPAAVPPTPAHWPRYTVLAALYDEPALASALIGNLARLDYPRTRLEGWLVLEADDDATLAAIEAASRPSWLKVLIVPPGSPRTKPRALNHALDGATGDLIAIYDAEDAPDPGQLYAAAARFAAEPGLGCLQAPLRIRLKGAGPSAFLDRQFALEYASLFEVALPGMARLGAPFPLGGTSNHLRVAALRAAGGWDAHNVTEDADLGFRLWSEGWRLGVIDPPTWETPPGGLDRWLPQRTRWLKGYMQTWGVHTRRPGALGRRGLLSLVMTLGAAIVSAAAHAPTLAWLASAVLIGLHSGLGPAVPASSVAVLAAGLIAAWMTAAVGARRAGLRYRLSDMLTAPAYWSLLSLAFAHAVWRLIREPFVWDKTPHDARADAGADGADTLDAGREAA